RSRFVALFGSRATDVVIPFDQRNRIADPGGFDLVFQQGPDFLFESGSRSARLEVRIQQPDVRGRGGKSQQQEKEAESRCRLRRGMQGEYSKPWRMGAPASGQARWLTA